MLETIEAPKVTQATQTLPTPVDGEYKTPLRIFLFGLAGVGKDSVASILRDQGFYTTALADGIRHEYVKFVGSFDFKRNRAKMIEIGETYKSIYGQDVWCRQTASEVWDAETSDEGYAGYVITDCRYNHEYDYFVERDWTPVQIVADEKLRRMRLVARDGSAQEETLQFEATHFITRPAKYTITNDGTIDDLKAQVDAILRRIRQ